MKLKPTNKKLLIILGITVITAQFCIGIILYDRMSTRYELVEEYLAYCESSVSVKEDYIPSLESERSELKKVDYTNNFYNFKVRIPDNWEVEEYKQDNGSPTVKFSAYDGDLEVLMSGRVNYDVNPEDSLDGEDYMINDVSIPLHRYFNRKMVYWILSIFMVTVIITFSLWRESSWKIMILTMPLTNGLRKIFLKWLSHLNIQKQ